jgi:uncharacterized protein YjbJ (UPF0337 family)
MNRDQVKGSMKDAAGKVQRKVGEATDSPKHVIKGAAKQAVGKVQKAVGDAREDSKRER